MKQHHLRNRIISFFVGSSVLISLLFGLTSFLFAYHVEDQFFAELLQTEAQYLQLQQANGVTATPRMSFIHYYPQRQALPAAIQSQLHQSPQQREFALSDGRHFHLLALTDGYLLADVTEHLVVRNIKPAMLLWLLVLLGLAVVLAAVLAYLVVTSLLKPLKQLMQLLAQAPVQQLPQGFSERFGNDEIGIFAGTLEQALQRIRQFIEREQQFTRDVSHELRTPVTISSGALTLLKQTELSPEQQALVERLDDAQQQIELNLSTLLMLAREQRSTTPHSRLLPLVERSILQQHSKLADKAIAVDVDIAPQASVALAEGPMLVLLNNLIGNAFCYTLSGTIRIYYQQDCLCISDTGKGIDDTLQAHVFDAGVKDPQSQGMGIGLSLVKRLCEKFAIGCTMQSSAAGTCICLHFNHSAPPM
jgi:signal transduction histidine kinase